MKAAPGENPETASAQGDDSTGVGHFDPLDLAIVWAKVPAAILLVELSKPALRLFIAMSKHADGVTRDCFAGHRTLSEELGWDLDGRRVRKTLPELEGVDLIRHAGIHKWGPRVWTRNYLIAPYPWANGAWYPHEVRSESSRTSTTEVRSNESRTSTTPATTDLHPVGSTSGPNRPLTSGPNRPLTSGPIRPDNQTQESDPRIKPTKSLRSRSSARSSELLEGNFEERRAKARAKLDEEIATAKATADPVPCPACGAERADVGYEGHGNNCPRFHHAS